MGVGPILRPLLGGAALALLACDGSLAAASSDEPKVEVEQLSPNSYRMTLTAVGMDHPAQGQAYLAPRAEALCGALPMRLGHYSFDMQTPLDAVPGSLPSTLIFRQDVTCGESAASAPAPSTAAAQTTPDLPPRDVLATQVSARTATYFAKTDSGDFRGAYELFDSDFAATIAESSWTESGRAREERNGGLELRRITNTTWYENPSDAPKPGLYVAVDYSATWANSFECGYVVWYRGADGTFGLVRHEQNFMPRSGMSAEDMASARAQFRCVD